MHAETNNTRNLVIFEELYHEAMCVTIFRCTFTVLRPLYCTADWHFLIDLFSVHAIGKSTSIDLQLLSDESTEPWSLQVR